MMLLLYPAPIEDPPFVIINFHKYAPAAVLGGEDAAESLIYS